MAVIIVEPGKQYVAAGVALTYDERGLRTGMLDTGTKLYGVSTSGKYGIVAAHGPGWHELVKNVDRTRLRVELTKLNQVNSDGTTTSFYEEDPPLIQTRVAVPPTVADGGAPKEAKVDTGETYFVVKNNRTLPTYSKPQQYGTKIQNNAIKGSGADGTRVTVYARWTDSTTGTVYGAVDSGYTQWIELYTRGQLNSNMAVVQKTQSAPGSNTQNQSNTAPAPKKANEPSGGGGNMPVVSDSGDVVDTNDDTYVSWEDAYAAANERFQNNDYGKTSAAIEAVAKMQHCIGLPPLITAAADPRYMSGSSSSGEPGNSFGRSYIEMFLMNNCTVNLKPIGVKYLPGLEKDKSSQFVSQIVAWAGGAQDDEPFTKKPESLQGQLWDTESKYSDYIETVNVLARTIAQLMGIGDRQFPGGKSTYNAMDYTYYNVQGQNSFFQDVSAGWSGNSGNGLFAQVGGALAGGASHLYQRGVTDIINDESYVHFYMSGDGFSSNDNISVTTKSTSIEGLFNNGLSELAADLQFLFGNSGALDTFADGIGDTVGGLLDATGLSSVQALNGIIRNGANYLKGARIVFPQQLDDCTYDRSLSCSCRFISPNGDPESQFLYCYLPLCYLWPYVLPQMLTDNMYRYPFMCKVDAPGIIHSDLAAVTNMRIQRGGPDGTNWGIDGRAFEIAVSFDVTPLYSKLMVTSSRHPILFMTNTALHEYLGSMVGVNFTGDSFEQKLQIAMNLLQGSVKDTLTSSQRGYIDSGVANLIRKVFNFG